MAFFQIVVWNAGAEVVDVVESNISCEPLKYFWKLVEGAAMQGGGGEVPLFPAFPVNVFILMLNIEHFQLL